MHKFWLLLFVFLSFTVFSQQSDFDSYDFTSVDKVAKRFKAKRLYDLNNITYHLTKDFDTDIEKFRAIFIWITHNISNDYKLYAKNSRKRERFQKDSLKLEEWNSKFKKIIFKKLLRKKRTICTGYAYLLKEMSDIIGVKAEIVHGFGRTAEVDVTQLEEPNHSWNVVKLNGKWYLCDPTWAAGISYPDSGKFVFEYNDGLFLTDPALFIYSHFPAYEAYTLLPQKISLTAFAQLPLLYSSSYNLLNSPITPSAMHQSIQQNEIVEFKFDLKENIEYRDVDFRVTIVGSVSEKSYQPEVLDHNSTITLKHQFTKKGFYDVHIYLKEAILASYTVEVKKPVKS